jgi:Protein of unknown function (DUF2934)
MEREITQRIRERAYDLWIAGGSAVGHSELNWLAAEKEILSPNLDTPPGKLGIKKLPKAAGQSRKRATSPASSISAT